MNGTFPIPFVIRQIFGPSARWIALTLLVTIAGAAGDGEEKDTRRATHRDPFAPIERPSVAGDTTIVPQSPPEPSPATTPTDDQWESARGRVKVRGVIRASGQTLVNINDRVVGVGDSVELREGEWVFRWRVETIGESGVTLQRLEYIRAPPEDSGRKPPSEGSFKW